MWPVFPLELSAGTGRRVPHHGFLREGAPADIVVYDFDKLRRVPEVDYEVAHDFPANEWRRIQRAEGYRRIIVNGGVTFKDSVSANATPAELSPCHRSEWAQAPVRCGFCNLRHPCYIQARAVIFTTTEPPFRVKPR